MGGFKVEVEEQFSWILVDGDSLTPSGVLLLAQLNLLPHLHESAITDRCKEDIWSKILTLVQVSWFAFQLLKREISGLPITLLERHTFAHVCCALVLYLAWLRKPKDLNEPFTIRIPHTLAAVMAGPSHFNSRYGFHKRTKGALVQADNAIRTTEIACSSDQFFIDIGWVPYRRLIPQNLTSYRLMRSLAPSPAWDNLSELEKGRAVENAIQKNGAVMLLPNEQLGTCPWSSRSLPIDLSQERADKIVRLSALEETEEDFKAVEEHVNGLLIPDFPQLYLTATQPNARDPATSYHFTKPYRLLAILGLVYGALHACPNYMFPTGVEKIMYLACVGIVGVGGFVTWGMLAVFHAGGTAIKDVSGLLLGVFVVIWSAARSILLLESIADMRLLPLKSYTLPHL
jgi:hypothetical protein